MSLTLTSYGASGGILTIDAALSSPAGYKILTYWVLCNGEYADECVPVYNRWPKVQTTMTTARRVSVIDLSNYPNGTLTFTLYAWHKSLTSSATTDETPISITVENVWNVPLKVPAATTYRVMEEPVVTIFDVPATATGRTIPVSLSAKDNNAVAGYFVSESPTTPLVDDPAWAVNPTEYTIAGGGTVTLYAWAKDAEGNISDPVSASVSTGSVIVGVIDAAIVELAPIVAAPALTGVQVGSIAAAPVSLTPTVAAPSIQGIRAGSISAPSVSLRPSVSPASLSGVQVGSMTVPAVTLRPSVAVGTLTGVEAVSVGSIAAASTTMQIQVNPPTLRGVTAGTAIRAPDGTVWDLRDIYGAPLDIRAVA